MKFINYLTSISGVEIFPLVSFIIFFAFFTLLTIWALKVNKKYISTLKHLPFSASDEIEETEIHK